MRSDSGEMRADYGAANARTVQLPESGSFAWQQSVEFREGTATRACVAEAKRRQSDAISQQTVAASVDSFQNAVMRLWKINCMEDQYPGMWQRWFKLQCVGIGWCAEWGYKLEGTTNDRGWSRARNALKEVAVGDHIVVALSGHRIGRIGEVTKIAIADNEWNPLVPPSKDNPEGEMGRRLLVRWDMLNAPESRDQVIHLPESKRFSTGELRPTICELHSCTLAQLQNEMKDRSNWVGLVTSFDYERSLQGYIAAYPYHLEDGLLPHPDKKIRERVFKDGSRSDVLLIDADQRPVVVECKQGSPGLGDLEQIRNYMKHIEEESEQKPRGILVHGGARKLSDSVRRESNKEPKIELVRYSVKVDFDASN